MSARKTRVRKPKKGIQKAKEIATYPPLRLLVEACVNMVSHKVVAKNPQLITLRQRLLELGGLEVCFREDDALANVLIEHGALFSTEGLQVRHVDYLCDERDVALLCAESENQIEICHGYSRNPNGLWVQHHWGFEAGRIVETTWPRHSYFGVVVDMNWTIAFMTAMAPELIEVDKAADATSPVERETFPGGPILRLVDLNEPKVESTAVAGEVHPEGPTGDDVA